MNSHQRVVVVERSQIAQARALTHQAARQAGLPEDDQHRAGTIATELCTNLVKHTDTGGELLVRGDSAARPPFVELIAIDRGRGINDVAAAFRDGLSTSGSPGTGLGAIRRMSDTLDISSQPGKGTVLVSRVRAGRRPEPRSGFAVGVVAVPFGGEEVSGDAWMASCSDEQALVVVVDGLGHGQGAHEAAIVMLGAVAERFSDAPSGLLERMHDAGRHTRGAAGAISRIRKGNAQVEFAGVGNIGGVIVGAEQNRHMVSNNGTLGHQVRTFRDFEYPWAPESMLLMHTDGLSTHWSLDAYPGLTTRHPAVIAATLYRDFSRQRDDVTVVVVVESR